MIIYVGSEIARLEKSLPDEDPEGSLDDYQKLKKKLNAYFLPMKNKHYARYMFLKTKPEPGEATVAYAARLREKAIGCDFGDTSDDRILEHIIQTIENQHLIQKCISKGWTLQQFFIEAGQIEDTSVQVHDMKADTWNREIARVEERRRNWTMRNSDSHGRDQRPECCTYCGLTGAHSKGRNCPAYGVQCDICKKFNHYSSVCRENMRQTEMIDDARKKILHGQQKKKDRVKKFAHAKEYSNSEMSSDDQFLEESMNHMRIKTVKRSAEENSTLSQEIEVLQKSVTRLEKELTSARQLIQKLIARQKKDQHTQEDSQIQREEADLSNRSDEEKYSSGMDEKVHVVERERYTPCTDTVEGISHLDCENIEMPDTVTHPHALERREEGNENTNIQDYHKRRRTKTRRRKHSY